MADTVKVKILSRSKHSAGVNIGDGKVAKVGEVVELQKTDANYFVLTGKASFDLGAKSEPKKEK